MRYKIVIYIIFFCTNAYCQNSDILYRGTIKVVRPKDCYVTIAEKKGGSISIQQLLDIGEIEMPCCRVCEFVSFDMSFLVKKKFVKFTNVTDITEEIVSAIKSLEMGQNICFENITFERPDGTVRKVTRMEFFIIDY